MRALGVEGQYFGARRHLTQLANRGLLEIDRMVQLSGNLIRAIPVTDMTSRSI